MAADIGADAAPEDTQTTGVLIDKVEALARLCATLHGASQRASAENGLNRTRLGAALSDALLAREALEAEARSIALTGYQAAARPFARPRRYNRIARRLDGALERLGSIGQALVIARSGLWASQAGEGRRLRAIAAYARRGGDLALQPPALFDQAWYLRRRSDLAGTRVSPLAHYLLHGAAEGIDPHPLFDGEFYRARNAAQLAETGLSPLEHFVRIGAGEGRDPHPLFDVGYYVRQAPDLISSGENPILHYEREGAARGLSPHPLFAADYYAAQVAQAGLDDAPSLAHYLTAGAASGLKPHPLFDPGWYRGQYPDVAAGGEPLVHFLLVGGAEGRSPSAWFDTPRYLALRVEGLAPGRNPLVDYLQGGAWRISEPWLGRPEIGFLDAAADCAGRPLTPLERWARAQTPSA
ncbi:hypothetical protein [Phenylobacterium sp.]|uniref:hypothetical protein n=1 Tax=Phenylobacterium sp. TaxID=1871053 RepID=UPI00289FB098|nr:hypothetical protein [Phenylobacterium sp.]